MVSSEGGKVDGMKHRAMVVLLVLGAAVAGFLSVGLVRAADDGPDLGEPVVVTPSAEPSPGPSLSGSTGRATTGDDGEGKAGTPEKSTPTPRKIKAEPVKPPSPRPGGGGDDDDDGGGDDGGGDDDGGDDGGGDDDD
jgi:hypothetical protein